MANEIYWKDIKPEDHVVRAGNAYVASQRGNRLVVYWLGQEADQAVKFLDGAVGRTVEKIERCHNKVQEDWTKD